MSTQTTKTIWLLNIDNYAPEITDLTYPFIDRYAEKIGANIEIIDERWWPAMPVVYEKLQIGRRAESDWNIYIDSDALIHPDCLDVTEFLTKDQVLHFGADFAGIRWTYDKYFKRDGRNIGSCNWFTVSSNWTVGDLYTALNIGMDEALENIHTTMREQASGIIEPDHLIDDYVLSRNIARFGLHALTVRDLIKQGKVISGLPWMVHWYDIDIPTKVERIKAAIHNWNNPTAQDSSTERGTLVAP